MDTNRSIYVCNYWLSKDKKDVYVFAEDDRVDVEEYRDSKTREVKLIPQTIYPDDTVDTFVHKVSGYGKLPEPHKLYGWYQRRLDENDLYEMLDLLYDGRAGVLGSEASAFFDLYLPKRVRFDSEALYDRRTLLETLRAKRVNKRLSSVGFQLRSTVSERSATISIYPFDESIRGADEARRVSESHRAVFTMACVDDVFNFVSSEVLQNPVYFEPTKEEGAELVLKQIKRTDALLHDIDDEAQESLLSKQAITSYVKRLVLRVLPRGGGKQNRLDIGNAFATFPVSEEMPIVCYQSGSTNTYKTNRDFLRTTPPTMVRMITQKEELNRDRVYKRKLDALLIYCVFEKMTFHLWVSENSSYRLVYRFRRSSNTKYEKIARSFELVERIIRVLDDDRESMFSLHPKLNVFDHPNIEIVEQITDHTVVTNRKLVTESTMRGNLEQLSQLFTTIPDRPKHFKYVRVDRYRNVSPLVAFVHQNVQTEPSELLTRVMSMFELDEQNAKRAIDVAQRDDNAPGVRFLGGRVFAANKYHPGLTMQVVRANDTTLRVKINHANPIYTDRALRALLYGALSRRIRKAVLPLESPVVQNVSEPGGATFQEMVDTMEHSHLDDQLDAFLQNTEFEFNFESDVESVISFHEEEQAIPESPPSVSTSDEIDPQLLEEAASVNDKSKYTTFVLNKLIEADRELFQWDNKRYRNYASKCGAVNYRQPIVITKEEKRLIDKEHPDSYTGYVKTGSTPELKERNFYICPKLWCKLGRYSITKEEYEKNGNRCGAPYYEAPLMFPPPGVKNYFETSDGTEKHYPHFLKDTMHPKRLLMPCCAKRSSVAQFDNESDDTSKEDTKGLATRYIARVAFDLPLAKDHLGAIGEFTARVLARSDDTKQCVGPLNRNTRCVVRTGVDNRDGHSFARCVEAILQLPNLYEAIAEQMEIWHFMTMNGGNTLRLFSDVRDLERMREPKEFQDFLTYLSAAQEYVAMFGLEDVVKAARRHGETVRETHAHYAEIAREFMILQSFHRFKAYILDERFAKTEDDLHHLVHYNFLNPQRVGVFVLEERGSDDTLAINPKYFELGEEIQSRQIFGIIIRVDQGYEYLQRVHGNDKRVVLFNRSHVEPILRAFPFSKVSARVNDGDTHVIGYDMKWRGVLRANGDYDAFEERRVLSTTSGPPARVRYDTVVSKEMADAEIFAASSHPSSQTYDLASVEVAEEVLKRIDLKQELVYLRHELNPLRRSEKMTLATRVLKELLQPYTKEQRRAICESMLRKPLEFIIADYKRRNQLPDPNDFLFTRAQVIRGGLETYYVRSLNVYRMWDTSADDNVRRVDSVVIDRDVKQTDVKHVPSSFDAKFQWVEQYDPLTPVILRKRLPGFEIHARDLTTNDLLALFDIDRERFVTGYLERMAKVYEQDKRAFNEEVNSNPSMKEYPKLNKAWPLDDLAQILRDDGYMLGMQQIAAIAEITKKKVLFVGRTTKELPKGIFKHFFGEDKEVVVLHFNKDVIRLVVVEPRRPTVTYDKIQSVLRANLEML